MTVPLFQSERMEGIPLSGIRHIVAKAVELQMQGVDVIRLELGEPDFDSPAHINEAAKKALNEGKVHYPHLAGIPELRAAISNKLKSENGLNYEPDEIIVTAGVAQGIFASIMCFLNPGEEILIPDPGFMNYPCAASIAQGTYQTYTLREESGFQPDINEIINKIHEKTKMIALITPNNPTGSILNRDTLEKIALVAKDNNLLVITDEIYERLVYDGDHDSIATIPGMRERTIILNGFSKYYAMTGWRLGYVAAPREMIDPMLRFSFYNTTSANSFAQYGALEALKQSNDPSEKMKYEYKKRRDHLVDGLNKIDKLSCRMPEGAFYVFLNIKETGLSSEDFSMLLLDKASVSTVPGIYFGEAGEGYVRISYASSFENIVETVNRIRQFVENL